MEVGGVTIEHATLHNLDEVIRKDVRVGDRVVVQRAGDVIPEVHSVIKDARTEKLKAFKMPSRCPACGASVDKIGAIHYCTGGLACPAQLKETISHFVSKRAMDIDGLGARNIEQFLKHGLIKDLADIYYLDKEKLLSLEGWREKSVENLLKAIEASKRPRLSHLIYSLGIRGVGERTAKVLATEFGSIEGLKGATKEALMEVGEIGPETAKSIVDFFGEEHNLKVLKKLGDAGVVFPIEKPREKKGRLSGLTILFTGSLDTINREEAKKMVEAEGGTQAASISKKVNLVVAGDDPGSKYDKARKLGLKIIGEKEFLRMVGADKA